MRYFELMPDKEAVNPIQILRLDSKVYKNGISKEAFSKIPSLTVGYFEHSPERELYDVLQEPAFLVSDRMKRLLSLYDPGMEFKGIQLFAVSQEDNTAPLYWLPYVASLDCLSNQTGKYANGMLEKLVLNRKKVVRQEIFRVEGILEHKIIVSLPLAESMLRRGISGITFVPVHFSGGDYEQR
ncbi:MAG: imm11 family protein [Lachnospiraceae bacterium]